MKWNYAYKSKQNQNWCMSYWDLSCSTDLSQSVSLLNMNTVFCMQTESETSWQKDRYENWMKWRLCGKNFLWKVTPSQRQSLDAHSRKLPFLPSLKTHLWFLGDATLPFFITTVVLPKINSKTNYKAQRHPNFDKEISNMVVTVYHHGNTVWEENAVHMNEMAQSW